MTPPGLRLQGLILGLGGLVLLVLTLVDFATGWRSFPEFFFHRPRPSLTDGVAGLALFLSLTSAGLVLVAGGDRVLRVTRYASVFAFFAFVTYLLQVVFERGQGGVVFVWLAVTAGVLAYLRAYRLALDGGRGRTDAVGGLLGGTRLALKALAAALAIALVFLAVFALRLDVFDGIVPAIVLLLGSLPLWVLALSLAARRSSSS